MYSYIKSIINILLLKLFFNKYLQSRPLTFVIIAYLDAKGIHLTENQVEHIYQFVLGAAANTPQMKLEEYFIYICNVANLDNETFTKTTIIYIINECLHDFITKGSDIYDTAINTLQHLYQDQFVFDEKTNEFVAIKNNIPTEIEPTKGNTEDEDDKKDDEMPQNPYIKYGLMAVSALLVVYTISSQLFA